MVLNIDPATFTYSATVELVTPTGTVVNGITVSGLSFDQNVIGNGQNGVLLFYVQASAGTTAVSVDNINISGVPEPSALALAGSGFLWVLALRRRSQNGK